MCCWLRKTAWHGDALKYQCSSYALVWVMTRSLLCSIPLSKPTLSFLQWASRARFQHHHSIVTLRLSCHYCADIKLTCFSHSAYFNLPQSISVQLGFCTLHFKYVIWTLTNSGNYFSIFIFPIILLYCCMYSMQALMLYVTINNFFFSKIDTMHSASWHVKYQSASSMTW